MLLPIPRGLASCCAVLALALSMGLAQAKFQGGSQGDPLVELRAREWQLLQARDRGVANDTALRSLRFELLRTLLAAPDPAAAGRLAARMLETETPLEPGQRSELLGAACAYGVALELDARVASYAVAGWLEADTRLELAERWLEKAGRGERGEAAAEAAERILAPFRDAAATPLLRADALRAELALRRGRDVAATELLHRVAAAPPRDIEGYGDLLLRGAEQALARCAFEDAQAWLEALPQGSDPAQRARAALVRATLARSRADDAAARNALAIELDAVEAPLRARISIAAARNALAVGAVAEADALLQRAAPALAQASQASRMDLAAANAQLALAQRDIAALREILPTALSAGRWCGGDAAGEALECLAAWLAERLELEPRDLGMAAHWLGCAWPLDAGTWLEIRVRGPRRAFVIATAANDLRVREASAAERAQFRVGARLYESMPVPSRSGEVAYAEYLDAASLARAMQREVSAARADGREFLGFGTPLFNRRSADPKVEDELRAVAQCFPFAEQHLHLGREATQERLQQAALRRAPHGASARYRVLHLIAEVAPGPGAARLRLADAEGQAVIWNLAHAEELATPLLPAADLVVLSLYDNDSVTKLAFDQLQPWVKAILDAGARAVWIGVRNLERDEDARREIGHFYAALAEGESAARAALRARSSSRHDASSATVVGAGSDERSKMAENAIFQFFGAGEFRARGWSAPDLTVLAPERVRQPWWIYFVTALIVPALVFLIFRRLSTGQVRSAAG